MESTLKFISGSTVTPEEFKMQHRAEFLEVKRNKLDPTKQCFLANGIVQGAVSKKGVPTDPVISRVVGTDGKTFYLMHEKPQYQNLETVCTF